MAAVTAFAPSSVNITVELPGLTGVSNITYEQIFLRNGTLEDITELVDQETGSLAATFRRPCGSGRFRVFAFYERQTEHQNLKFKGNSTGELWDNGSYAVDHFSARGAQVTTDFWDQYILSNDDIKEKLRLVGNYGKLSKPPFSPNFPQTRC